MFGHHVTSISIARLHLFLAAFACASLMDKGYWDEEDPFDAQKSFFEKKVWVFRQEERNRNRRSIKNNTTSSGDGF
uniref:Secreted protein n=1 Tax=Tanacetum cinerariifolium TaxID=118510 RepID=A0A699I038_TANCI|nr:hypothetical protein [Tanacetum cinerariifolium]